MLPEDARWCREAVMDSSVQTQQTMLSDHFNPHDTQIIPYSDKVFEEAMIEWLIQMNQVCSCQLQWYIDLILVCQPIQAFKHLSFKMMLNIGSQASKGVSLLSPKKTHVHIINMFKLQMYILRDHLNVSVHNLLPYVLTLTIIR